MNILFVDDDALFLRELLGKMDWDIFHFTRLEAGHFDEAVRVFKSTFVDILVTDIEMPGQDGLSLIEYANEHSPHTECIILTRHNDFRYAQAAVRLNCIEYLLKPVQDHQLKNVLIRAARRVEMRRQHEQISQYANRYLSDVAGRETTKETSPLDIAVEYIDTHLSEELSVRELAVTAYVSADHLTRLFKKKFGLTVSEYIQDKRLHLAAQLLQNKEMTVSAVAAKVGFNHYSYFSEQFKRIYEITPREYQKQCLEQQLQA